jgi:hypothetical protein
MAIDFGAYLGRYKITMASSPIDNYTNERFRGAVLLDELVSSPATPSPGQGALYLKPNGGMYLKNDAGDEQKINTNLPSPVQLNIFSYSMPPTQALTATDTPTTARPICVQLPWHSTEVVGNYYFRVHTAGTSLSATGLQNSCWLCTGAGVMIPNTASANLATVVNSTGDKTVAPSTGPVSVPADPLGYIYWVILLTFTGTAPIIRGSNPGAQTCNVGLQAGINPLLFFRNGTSKTAPGDITITTGATLWNSLYVSLGP